MYRQKVEKQIYSEISSGNYEVVSSKPPHISALGAIPMSNTDKIRLISQSKNIAVNDYATAEKFRHQSINDAVSLLTPCCYLAKVYLTNAYRSGRCLVPIRFSVFRVSSIYLNGFGYQLAHHNLRGVFSWDLNKPRGEARIIALQGLTAPWFSHIAPLINSIVKIGAASMIQLGWLFNRTRSSLYNFISDTNQTVA